MTTPQFIEWLDGKLSEYGGGKVIPPADVLAAELRDRTRENLRTSITERILREARIEDQVQTAMNAIPPPDADRLTVETADWLAIHEDESWRDFVARVASTAAAA